MRRLVVLGVVAALVVGGCGAVSADDYRARNETLLDTLPVFPGAGQINAWDHEYRDGNGWPEGMGPVTGYSTTRVFRVPDDTSAEDVKRFYRANLSAAWTQGGEDLSGIGFRRDRARLWISLDPARPGDPRPAVLLVEADHAAYRGAGLSAQSTPTLSGK